MEGGGLGIDYKILIGDIATFIVLVVILKKFAYGKFVAVLEQRRQKIEDGVKKSEEAEKSLVKIRGMAEEIKNIGEKKAKEAILAAEGKAQEKAKVIMEAAEVEKRKLIESAKIALAKEEEVARARRQGEAMELALAVSEKFLGQKMTKEIDKKLIEKLAAEL
jgi:F-type H+-transporting ATPase subunit b